MNLGKLLVAGRSVIGGRRQIAYRISDRAYLPKFISPKNPFAPPAKAEPPPSAVATPIKKGMASDGTKTQKLPTFPAVRARRRTWISRLNPASIWHGATPPAQKAQCPRQAELSLDRVKVMHNDLTDVDVEVVPIKSRPTPGAAEPAPTPANSQDSWSRLSAKIFGVKTA